MASKGISSPEAERIAATRAIGSVVRVHLNRVLSRPGAPVYSIARSGAVVARVPSLRLADARFVVSTAGRARSLALGTRTVHAWVDGLLVGLDSEHGSLRRVSYSPTRAATFTLCDDGAPIHSAACVVLADAYAWA